VSPHCVYLASRTDRLSVDYSGSQDLRVAFSGYSPGATVTEIRDLCAVQVQRSMWLGPRLAAARCGLYFPLVDGVTIYRAMLCMRGTSHGPMSVSVSVTSRCSTKTAKRRITQTTPHDLISSHLLFFKNSCQTQLCTKFINLYIQ